jgi:hypothetical protein
MRAAAHFSKVSKKPLDFTFEFIIQIYEHARELQGASHVK